MLYIENKTVAGIPNKIIAAKIAVNLLSLHLGSSSICRVYHSNLEIK